MVPNLNPYHFQRTTKLTGCQPVPQSIESALFSRKFLFPRRRTLLRNPATSRGPSLTGSNPTRWDPSTLVPELRLLDDPALRLDERWTLYDLSLREDFL